VEITWEARFTTPVAALGYSSDEYEIRGATNVHEVLAWAHETAGSTRTFMLYVFDEHGRHAFLLCGSDPTASALPGG
jgi:hypothetical protein